MSNPANYTLEEIAISQPQTTWQAAIAAIEAILPGMGSYQPPPPKVQSERVLSFMKKQQERREKSKELLMEQGKIPDLKSYFIIDHLFSFACQSTVRMEWDPFDEEQLKEVELWHLMFQDNDAAITFKGDVIVVLDICFPRVDFKTQRADFLHRQPFLFQGDGFENALRNFELEVFDGDALFIGTQTPILLAYHHEGGKLIIEGDNTAVDDNLHRYFL